MLQKEQTTAATANPCSAMESGNHLKNGVCLKNLMSRKNLLTILSVLFFAVFMGACKDGGGGEEEDNTPLATPTKVAATQVEKDIQQWEYIPSKTQWQRNSEFGQEGDIETVVDKKSAVIVLVLDCTSSLGSSGFRQMKEAATNFIKTLTNR